MRDEAKARRLAAWLSVGVVLGLIALLLTLGRGRPPETHAQDLHVPKQASGPVQATRFVAVAGGATPDSNPISLEQNLSLAHAVLPGPGVLLFGGGPLSESVQVLDDSLPHDALMAALGELFAPRAGRDSRYQATSLPVQAATNTTVRTELSIALSKPGTALLLYMSGHGEQAEQPRDTRIQLWGGDGLSVGDLAELHETSKSRRELRAVITSCYSGAFAELVFRHADIERGVASPVRCGLFATTFDLESSGCDPNPDRAAQEGYSLHFLNALRAKDRDGVTPIDVDYDDDGRITLLEAHTRARIAGRSIDVPTTTAERLVRALVPQTADTHAHEHTASPIETREEDVVIEALGRELGLDDEAMVDAALDKLELELDATEQTLEQAQADADAAYSALAMGLLSRWPVIDDPWHPLFVETLATHRDAILLALREEEPARVYADMQQAVQTADASLQVVEARYALLMRLARAYETRRLSRWLARHDPKGWARVQRVLSCERSAP